MRLGLILAALVLGGAAALAYLAAHGRLGDDWGAGEITPLARSEAVVADRARRQPKLASTKTADRQILFGDLHAHTTFSFDAYNISLPIYQGEGAHPPADACDFARFCSGLDFWSINDHAEGLTPRQWRETRETVRQCNAVAGDPLDPDLVTFLGWEWTQIGHSPADHYGHKNVVLRDTADDAVPLRPIASRDQLFPAGRDPYTALVRLALIAAAPGEGGRAPYLDFARFLQERQDSPLCEKGADVRALPESCRESAATPTELFDRLDAWAYPYLVIPHGNTWGFYTPALSSWDAQLAAHAEPEAHEFLIEVFSGHGNIEQYRPWRALARDETGALVCPAPSAGYTPECWRAGEIIAERCRAEGEEENECARRARVARANHVAAADAGHLTVPGARVEDWLDSGQCTDCYMPAYNHRPGGSVQYALALRDFREDGEGGAKRFRFGLIGSSDVHTARPGTGYKELARRRMTDAALGNLGPPAIVNQRDPEPLSLSPEDITAPAPYFERFASFFGTGGLVAAHSDGRHRDAIWDALQSKHVYGTSGDRILLWFDLLETPHTDRDAGRRPMGSSTTSSTTPSFEVRALGAFEQKPGCPADVVQALGAERLQRLCAGECYHPGDRRKAIDRIEVVRIRPQASPGEDVATLIDDPWLVHACPPEEEGCRLRFSDPEFVAGARDVVYYVRAIQTPSPTVNGDSLRCRRDELGRCLEVRPCRASAPTAYDDDCLAEVSERAWSSPIFVDYTGAR